MDDTIFPAVASSVAIVGIVFLFFLCGFFAGRTTSYKQGQIDAINGKICYELIELDNQEMHWQKVAGCE